MTSSPDKLQEEIRQESERFQSCYKWLENHMPPSFFQEIEHENVLLIAHSLMGFPLQDYFAQIHVKHEAFALCLDSPDADLKILAQHRNRGIRNYRSFVSNAPLPFPKALPLRVATISFTEASDSQTSPDQIFSSSQLDELFMQLQKLRPEVQKQDFEHLMSHLNPRFLRALTPERLVLALDVFFRARKQDACQYHVRYNDDWAEKKESPSLQIVFAWRAIPKNDFLYRLAKIIHRHKLALKKVNAIYLDSPGGQNILLMSIGVHGIHGKAAQEEANVPDFLQELVTLKYFEGMEGIDSTFVDSGLLRGNLGNLLKAMAYFVHQALVHFDFYAYSLRHIEEGICRHPELICLLLEGFEQKFHPSNYNLASYLQTNEQFLTLVKQLDTGNEFYDTLRKNILITCSLFVAFCLKTNFYRSNKTALSFRLDPSYLDHLPFDRKEKFPELPYAIYFMKGSHFLGFHIRFKDLSRGGLRTVTPDKIEKMKTERNNVFSECYGLAYTQQKKNKDIPEGGAKGVIFLEPFERLSQEISIFSLELEEAGFSSEQIEQKVQSFITSQKKEHLYQSQRSYIESFVTLINCHPDGSLKAKQIVDYLKKPEYIYLGPDENMHNEMIEWIAQYSTSEGYKPGNAFISSKPSLGINHKEFGVTSFGVNVYMEEALKYLGIDPNKDSFTLKMSGGPDGDVAGNQMLNLAKFYPNTAHLLATIDVSGTIFDPKGLDLEEIKRLFIEQKPIRFYPPEKLSEGGFLLDAFTKKEQSSLAVQTLCWKKQNGRLIQEWLSGNEMNHLLRYTVHQTKVDVFIPGGGRPRTLNESNIKEFLDEFGASTAKAVIEGANLYLTPFARRTLENLDVLVMKDSSSNKGGVICSSFEVLCSLCLKPEEFLLEKSQIVKEILDIIRQRALDEARLLLMTHKETGKYLTEISEEISLKINTYTYELLDYFQKISLSKDRQDPLNKALLSYCPPTLRKKYEDRIFDEIPDIHKKAIIACHIASRLVYTNGLSWSPSVVDILPLISEDPQIVGY
jgi:glutamate dehydrogenase